MRLFLIILLLTFFGQQCGAKRTPVDKSQAAAEAKLDQDIAGITEAIRKSNERAPLKDGSQ